MGSATSCVVVVLALLLSPVQVTALPSANITSLAEIEPLYRLFGFIGCSDSEKRAIYDSLNEMHTITGVSSVQEINWAGAAAVDFFG